MKNGLSVISSPKFGEVRSVMLDGEAYFVAKDVCAVLGISNHRDAVARLEDYEKRESVTVDTLGGRQKMTVINESGLYGLVFQSRKPEAKAFRRWVTQEVLPSIRKYGYYISKELELNHRDLCRLRQQMLSRMKVYLTNADLKKCARRLGVDELYVFDVLSGKSENNSVMNFLQNRAMENYKEWENAYGQGRMTDVLDTLNGKK